MAVRLTVAMAKLFWWRLVFGDGDSNSSVLVLSEHCRVHASVNYQQFLEYLGVLLHLPVTSLTQFLDFLVHDIFHHHVLVLFLPSNWTQPTT